MALLTNINGKFSVSDAGAVTFNNAFTFPTADGTANYVLKTNGSGQLAWGPDNDGGDITGSGTANKVTQFTGAKTIGDGPITFSNSSATATSTFGGPVTSGTITGTSRIQSDDNMYMVGGQFYMGASDGTTNDTYRFYASSGVYYLQSRKSGTWTTYLSIGSDAHASFDGQVSATHFDSTSTTANIFLGSLISKPDGASKGFILRNDTNAIIGQLKRTTNTTSELKASTLDLGGTTAQYVRGDGSFATYSPGTGTVTGSGTANTMPVWTSASVLGDSIITTGSPAGQATVGGVLNVTGNSNFQGSVDVLGVDDIRVRFLKTTTFKAGLQVPTTAGDMITNSAVDDFCIRSQTNILFATGGATERMRIDNVGVLNFPNTAAGTGTGGSIAHYTNNYMYIKGGTGGLAIGDDGFDAAIYLNNSDSIQFQTGGSERMRIKSDGNIDITTPITNAFFGLSLKYSTTEVAVFKVNNATGQIDFGGNAAGYFPTFASAGIERMRITAAGTIKMTDENGGVPILQARNFSVAATGAFTNGYAMEFRGATTTGAGNGMMLLHMNEADDARPTLDIASSNGIFARFTNGKVGIGTTSPSAKLQVVNNSQSTSALTICNELNGGDGFVFQKWQYVESTTNFRLDLKQRVTSGVVQYAFDMVNNGTGYTSVLVLDRGKVGIGTTSPDYKLHVDGNIKSSTVTVYDGMGGTETGIGASSAGGYLRLYTGGVNRATVQSTAETMVLFGQDTVGSNYLQFRDSAGTAQGYIGFGASASDEYYIVQFKNAPFNFYINSAVRGSISTGGTLTMGGDIVAYGSPSDKRLKENIKPIKSALDKVNKLQGVTFDWKDKKQEYDQYGKPKKLQKWKNDIGFIAQDVQKIIPELVRENEDGMLSMRHQGIAPILLEAIKELKAEIEELKKQIK